MKQVIPVAEEYIINQLSNPERTVSENGMVTISDRNKKYVIDRSKILTGYIDDDDKVDAIISVLTFQGQFQTVSEVLVILKVGGEYRMVRALESDMRIISLKDRIITADVPEHSRNSPLFNCPSCWEVLKYQFRMGELERIE